MYNDEANLQNFMFSTNVQKPMCHQYDQVLCEDTFYRKKGTLSNLYNGTNKLLFIS